MDKFVSATTQVSHKVELYTDHLLIQGTILAPFRRTTDLLNRGETEFMAVQDALITPLGQQPSQKPIEGQVMIGRKRLHFAVEVPTPNPSQPKTGLRARTEPITDDLYGREAYVKKNNFPCFAITGTYAIYGYCHLHPETTLENLLRGADVFIPITKATIYMVAHTNITWQRELVVVNRTMLSAMYLTPVVSDQ